MTSSTCPNCLGVLGSVGCCRFKAEPTPKRYYFGCWGEPGHYLWTTSGNRVSCINNATPWDWSALDCGLCPGGIQVEGHAALHRKDGWTALAFWDRSIDTRPNSNSVFIAEGVHTAEEMGRISSVAFPRIWARFYFQVKVVET